MRKQVARCLVLAVAGTMLCAAAEAQSPQWDSYAVKFACGNIFPSSEPAGALGVKGKYLTSVNIHNPNYLIDAPGASVKVRFFKKIVLALPQGTDPLPPSCMIQEDLASDWSLSVNCRNIKAQLAFSGLPSTGPQEGFVVLLVPPFQDVETSEPPELDVTALYTARFAGQPSDPSTGINTWDVESVTPKDVIGDPVINLCSPD